jgi:hypothetical protein
MQPNGVTAPMPVAPPPPFADALLVGAPEPRSSSGERSVPHAAIDQLTGDPSLSSRPPPPHSYRAPAPDALQGEMVDPASFHEVG